MEFVLDKGALFSRKGN